MFLFCSNQRGILWITQRAGYTAVAKLVRKNKSKVSILCYEFRNRVSTSFFFFRYANYVIPYKDRYPTITLDRARASHLILQPPKVKADQYFVAVSTTILISFLEV